MHEFNMGAKATGFMPVGSNYQRNLGGVGRSSSMTPTGLKPEVSTSTSLLLPTFFHD